MRAVRVWMLSLATIVVAHGGAGRAAAQTPAGRTTLIPIPLTTYVAFNPSMVVFDFGSVEFESGVAQGITIGGVGSYMANKRDHYSSGDFNLRFYPEQVILRGVSIGLSGGVLRYSNRDSAGGRPAITTPTIGLRADYNWLIGPSPRFVVGTGLGVKRVLASETDRRRVDIDRSYFTARFVVGYAF
jgi:hypothetical protein